MNIHKLLQRQLKKNNLSMQDKPERMEDWAKFLMHVNQCYFEADQERYLQERSMQISSREVMALNQRLEKAQHIAKLGSWSYDAKTDRTIWSRELYSLFHFKKASEPPGFYEFLNWIHDADRYELKQKFEQALAEKTNFEQIMRVKIDNQDYCWFQMIGQSNEEDNMLSGIIMNIHEHKIAEEEISKLNQRLILTARQAGMAEVAASVLHNVGNILNTINISIDVLKNSTFNNYIQKFIKINEMMLEHQENLSTFLKEDPKGKLIPQYIDAILKVLPEEENNYKNELASLDVNFQHIKEIVSSQKLIGGVPDSLHEKIYIPELLDMVVRMVMVSAADKSISIEQKFEDSPVIETDKSKLLQILINLVQNARDSLMEHREIKDKKIHLEINIQGNDFINIIISDNGMGIDKENLERIFAFGFTTKKEGHGFGLHSSVLSAKQMGGSLLAESEGLLKGARFILSLPLKVKPGAS